MSRESDLQAVIEHMLGKPWDTSCPYVCEKHPHLIWPHDDCVGAGMPPLLPALCAKLAESEAKVRELEAKLANPITRDELETIAHEVYKADRFRDTDQVWCNLTWLTRFAQAIERHHGIADFEEARKKGAEL